MVDHYPRTNHESYQPLRASLVRKHPPPEAPPKFSACATIQRLTPKRTAQTFFETLRGSRLAVRHGIRLSDQTNHPVIDFAGWVVWNG